MALNIVALVVSAISLITSALLVWRQIGAMRDTNELPIIVDLTQEFRKPEFQRDEHYVVSSLAGEHPASLGCSNLPEEARIAVQNVISIFISLGAFVALNIAEERSVVSLFGYRADRAWRALEPYIREERRLRGGDPFARFFEDLVCRTRENAPWPVKYQVRLRQLPEPERAE